MAQRINSLIVDFRSKQVLGMANDSSRDLWIFVEGKTIKIRSSRELSNILSSPDLVNQFYATIAAADDYIVVRKLSLCEIYGLLIIKIYSVTTLSVKLTSSHYIEKLKKHGCGLR